MKSVLLKDLVSKLELEVVYQSSDYEKIEIELNEVNRPGLQLGGFLDNFPYMRLQVIGHPEHDYYNKYLPFDERRNIFDAIFSYPIPALIYTHSLEIPYEVYSLAKKHNRTILRSHLGTTKLISKMNVLLEYLLSEEIRIHGGLLEVFGIGVLIIGKSSIGKSETALELIGRGHRLVADDAVDIRKVDNKLVGECPKNIRHFLEIRGLGILDIQRLYGVGAVKLSTEIDLVIELENWKDDKEYDRLGLDDEYKNILGIEIPHIVIPVKPGRNIALIVEVATRNTRQKMYGYNAAIELNNRILEEIKNKTE
ncbi:MAG: HPr(Ser) kinase/phosphatase [Peptoniphilaceae bacterium]|uniref:HPr(Ser) kinase/phosphatase n=1 Tax=Parvimonas sp. TaxID=1944660 RepID=UPI0025CFDDB0|nr:HPr(Ser) kinase/phosphatase [Parvimonas sp.]MCI5997489.1 HPr(Ser) kinase/phosphatase [Parvimonas sp.]MDD7764598.1 HPr(Ser) kinase/phosphatase [Peptoniphilaceae bacterium]MDY3050574.1 HPr(Ser) kinase/phosphatase [Parvimonas sp.]